MNATSKIAIDILTQFKGTQDIKRAQNSFGALESSVDKLGKRLATVFGVAALGKFGKDSLNAFLADDKAAKGLAKTLENVGQGFQAANVEAFIKKTEATVAVLDDKLRPAFQTLVNATYSASKSQEILTTALDVSAGSGNDLETVTNALSKAYMGNTTALAKLAGTGLSPALIKGKSFEQIMVMLNKQFNGQAQAAADTYAGKVEKIRIAFENMKETVGKGIVDAFSILTADGSGVDKFTSNIQSVADNIANIIVGIGVIGNKIESLPGWGILSKIATWSMRQGILGQLAKLGEEQANKLAPSTGAIPYASGFMTPAQQKQQQNALEAERQRLAQLNAEKNKQLKLETAIAFLKKSQAIFDQQKIQIQAALLNKKLTADEKTRLELMKTQADLQTAIDDKNTSALDGLMSKITALRDQIDSMKDLTIGNPFADAARGAQVLADALKSGSLTSPMFGTQTWSSGASTIGDYYSSLGLGGSLPGAGGTQKVEVTVSVDEGLTAVVQQKIVDNTGSGMPSSYDRNKLTAW